MIVVRSVLIIFFSLCTGVLVFAQTADNSDIKNVPGGNIDIYNPLTSFQFMACVMCVIVGLIVFCGQFYLLNKSPSVTSDDIVKNCTITLVIIGALLLIIAGYSSQQTAQAFGLFGTVIGYLLGRSAGRTEAKANE